MKRDRRADAERFEPDYYNNSFRADTPAYTQPLDRAIAIGAYIVGDSVLDLGCGAGGLWNVVAPRRYLGVDFSSFVIGWAQNQNENPNAEFMVCSLYDLPDVGLFDTIVLMQVLEHLDDPWAIAKKALACAQYRVVVTVPEKGRAAQRAHVWPQWVCSDLEEVFGRAPTDCSNMTGMLVGVWDLTSS